MKTCKDCGGISDWYERVFYHITYECGICGFKDDSDKTEYSENIYINDRYRKASETRPEPREWFCPNHPEAPNIKKNLLFNELRSEKRTDDNEPYIREDDPDVLEDIEMEGEMCDCGHYWDSHFPPWSDEELARTCRFETCVCDKFKLMEIEEIAEKKDE